jgi:hypothetical protein
VVVVVGASVVEGGVVVVDVEGALASVSVGGTAAVTT